MRTIVVGGNFGDIPKASSIIKGLSEFLLCDCINGGTIDDIRNVDLSGYKLVIWAANIDNSVEKIYPKKDVGAIMIVTKVLREDRTEIDAITRIFTMYANAVIAIRSDERPFTFKLLDALGNVWCDTDKLDKVARAIIELAEWTATSDRMRCVKGEEDGKVDIDFSQYEDFIKINKQVADIFEENKGRYFGNTSTRCMKMFPTTKSEDGIIVSRRNSSKKRLTTDDLVLARFGDDHIVYYGENKPSVDTPIQLNLYKLFPEINYMIHGHSYIKWARYTKHYFPCGDMREVESAKEVMMSSQSKGVVNLQNHGFLIYADTIDNLRDIVNNIEFEERKVGFEPVNSNWKYMVK